MNAPWIKEEDVPAFAAWLDLFAEGQRALGYKAGLEAAVKVCHWYGDEADEAYQENDSEFEAGQSNGAYGCAAHINSLPVPEVQWRDLTDDEILVALGMQNRNEYEAEDVEQSISFARAFIAKFKEKQL